MSTTQELPDLTELEIVLANDSQLSHLASLVDAALVRSHGERDSSTNPHLIADWPYNRPYLALDWLSDGQLQLICFEVLQVDGLGGRGVTQEVALHLRDLAIISFTGLEAFISKVVRRDLDAPIRYCQTSHFLPSATHSIENVSLTDLNNRFCRWVEVVTNAVETVGDLLLEGSLEAWA